MPKDIYITQVDKDRLTTLIDNELRSSQRLDESMKKLKTEIENAKVVNSCCIPGDIITMNSQTVLHLNQEDIEISLVYPQEADWNTNKMSILSPIGTAILGYREGDIIEWEVPSGITQIEIKKVIYQPEAAGDYDI